MKMHPQLSQLKEAQESIKTLQSWSRIIEEEVRRIKDGEHRKINEIVNACQGVGDEESQRDGNGDRDRDGDWGGGGDDGGSDDLEDTVVVEHSEFADAQ